MYSNSGESFGIKLIWTSHLFPKIEYFDRALGDELPALMNFKNDAAGNQLARSLPNGHRCLVYVTECQKFIWAIEIIGSVEDGSKAARRHNIPPKAHDGFTVYMPIRFLTRVEPWENGPTRRSVCAASGVDFAPRQGDSHISLSREQYERMYRAINWSHEYE